MEAASQRSRVSSGFSLFEILLVIVIIGVLVLVTLPILRGIGQVSVKKTQRNAQQTAEVSNQLNSLDVAHVLPDSLGGARATTRLLRGGLQVENGTMEGAYLGMNNLPEEEVAPTAEYLDVKFDGTNLRLEYDASAK